MQSLSSHSIRLVLVKPLYSGNIGACARIAANFNLKELWLVSPQCDPRNSEAKLYAKGPALKYLEKFKATDSLTQALQSCTAAVGFTRRTGQLRQAQTTLKDISALVEPGPVALVFGREDQGLSRQELLQCTHICTLPTADVMPSLNLSHAVAVACARLFEDLSSPPMHKHKNHAALEELEALFSHWRQTMVDADIVRAGNPDRMLAHMKRALQRAELSTRDVALFRAYLSKTQVALGTRRNTNRKKKPPTTGDRPGGRA